MRDVPCHSTRHREKSTREKISRRYQHQSPQVKCKGSGTKDCGQRSDIRFVTNAEKANAEQAYLLTWPTQAHLQSRSTFPKAVFCLERNKNKKFYNFYGARTSPETSRWMPRWGSQCAGQPPRSLGWAQGGSEPGLASRAPP